jgi:hypothetical protein
LVLALLGAGVVITGFQADYIDYHYLIYKIFGLKGQTEIIRWDPIWSPLVGYWRLPLGTKFLLPRVISEGGWFLRTLFGAAGLGVVLALWKLIYPIPKVINNN